MTTYVTAVVNVRVMRCDGCNDCRDFPHDFMGSPDEGVACLQCLHPNCPKVLKWQRGIRDSFLERVEDAIAHLRTD